jgi:hypothetical protein
MPAEYAERSISGLRTYAEAVSAAVAFSETFVDEWFAVLHYTDERVYDVEPARRTDRVGHHGVVALARLAQRGPIVITMGDGSGPVQELNPSLD